MSKKRAGNDTQDNDKVDFRWGVPSLDESLDGGTHVPGFILKHYAELEVTVQEMMLIIHLSAYRFNSPGGKSSPSLVTIAHLMGYAKDDSVRRMVKALETRDLLMVKRDPGRPSVYDFSGLSQACLCLETTTDLPTTVGDSVSHSDGSPIPVGDPPSHSSGGLPPHYSGGEEIEYKKENLQERELVPSADTPNGDQQGAPPLAQESPAPETPTPKPPTPFQAMFGAICDVFGYPADTLTPEVETKIGKIGSSLVKAHVQPCQVEPFWKWICRKAKAEGWKRKPSMHAMPTLWPEYAKTLVPPPPPKVVVFPVTDSARRMLLFREEVARRGGVLPIPDEGDPDVIAHDS